MAIQFELYKTPRPKDEADKETYHARVVNFQHIDTDYLARQIQTATSLTEGDVKSVLESLSHFMGERLREGESVHLDGIGYFQIKLNSQEPITSPKLKANQIKLKANISFKADIKLKKSVSVVHLERSKVKRHSASRTNEEVDKLLQQQLDIDAPRLSRAVQLYRYHCRPAHQTAERGKEIAEYQYVL